MTDQERLDRGPADVLDLDEAAKRLPGGRDSVLKLASMLLQECPKLTDQMREALSNGDAKTLQRAAHTLKSSANVFAAKRVGGISQQLETLGKDGKVEEARSLFTDLEREVELLLSAVKKLTSTETA